jgi:1-acyl-sn-glycerol-3-phosphate acyltransferase
MMGCIPVYRTKSHNGDALRAAVAALEAGELIGIFPEGTIHHGGAMQELKRGVALLALKTGLPVVPLAIRGSGEAFPDGARVPSPGTIRLRFERPGDYPKTSLDPIPEDAVRDTLERIRRSVLAAMRLIPDPVKAPAPAGWLKPLRVAASGLVVLPLAWFLTLTANPSLDPVKQVL